MILLVVSLYCSCCSAAAAATLATTVVVAGAAAVSTCWPHFSSNNNKNSKYTIKEAKWNSLIFLLLFRLIYISEGENNNTIDHRLWAFFTRLIHSLSLPLSLAVLRVFSVLLFAVSLVSLIFFLFLFFLLSYAFQCGSVVTAYTHTHKNNKDEKKIVLNLSEELQNERTKMSEREKNSTHKHHRKKQSFLFFFKIRLVEFEVEVRKRNGLWFCLKIEGTSTHAQSIDPMHFADGIILIFLSFLFSQLFFVQPKNSTWAQMYFILICVEFFLLIKNLFSFLSLLPLCNFVEHRFCSMQLKSELMKDQHLGQISQSNTMQWTRKKMHTLGE